MKFRVKMAKTIVNLSLGGILLCFTASAVVAFYLGRYTSTVRRSIAASTAGLGPGDVCNNSESIGAIDACVYDTIDTINEIQKERRQAEVPVSHGDELINNFDDTAVAAENGDEIEDFHLFVKVKFEEDCTSLLPTSESHLEDIMMKIMVQHHSLSSWQKNNTHKKCNETEMTRGFSCVGTVPSEESNSESSSNVVLWTLPKDSTVSFSIFKNNTTNQEVMETLMLIQDEIGLQTTDCQKGNPSIWWSLKRQQRLQTLSYEKSHGSESSAIHEYDEAFYESFVHPVMFTHRSPEKVAIIGDGDGGGDNNFGATLREVLKHKTVKDVQIFMNQDSYHLLNENIYGSQDFYKCSNLAATTTWCDRNDNDEGGNEKSDKRVKINFHDAESWLNDIVHATKIDESDDSRSQELFDIMLVDTL